MKRLIYILLFFSIATNAQYNMLLRASQEQYDNESVELYTASNAFSTGGNEVDATTGILVFNATVASIESGVQDGTSVIQITGTGGGAEQAYFNLSLSDATNFTISFWAWTDSGLGTTQIWGGFTSSPSQNWTTTPTYYTYNLTTNSGTQTLRFYCSGVGYIDGLTITTS